MAAAFLLERNVTSAVENTLNETLAGSQAKETDSIWTSEKSVVYGLWIAWVLGCLPLLFIRILPAVDYPDHLARIYILAQGMSLPGYANFYQPHWAFLPNLAFDLVMVPLAKIMPVELAGRLFVCGVFALTIYGGAKVNKALTGKWTWLALIPALLLYNRILAYGFLNYLCGLSLLLVAFGFHIEHRNSATWKRLLIEALFLCGLFACHLVAMAMYVACAIAYDFGQWRQRSPGKSSILRDLGVVLLPTFAILAAFVKFSPTTNEAVQMEFRDWLSKFKLIHMTFQSGQGAWDLIFAFLVLLLLVWMLSYRKVKIDKSMIYPIVLMTLVFIVSPTGFKDAMNVDTRIPLAVTLIIFVSFIPSARYSAQMGGACVLGLLGFRSFVTVTHYAEWDRQVSSIVSDLRQIPQGSIVLDSRNIDSHAFDTVAWDPPLLHLDCLLLLERPVLAQDLFTIPSQQPLLKKAPYSQIDLTAKVGGSLARNLQDYGREAALAVSDPSLKDTPTYFYYVREPGALNPPPELDPVVVRDRYAIYRVEPAELANDHFTLPAKVENQKKMGEEIERWNMSN